MKIIHCPLNGPRPQQEFVYGGRYREMPDPEGCSDEAWAEYLYHRDGAGGVRLEWWYHVASGTWFIAERDTRTDTFIRTFLYSEMNSHEH